MRWQKQWHSVVRQFLTVAIISASMLGLPGHGQAAEYYSDTSLSYRYGTAFKEPGVAGGDDIIKNILNFQHFNADAWGSNLFYIDALFSHSSDPADETTHGATEFYGIYRRDWSLSKITDTDLSYGIIRDIALHMGGDINTKNASFQPRKQLIVIGPQLQFAIPSGYFNIAFDYSQEWGHNGIVGENVRYDPAFQIESVWGVPFYVAATKWNFTGFLVYTAPKGRDGFGAQTKQEVLTRPELLLDVGALVGGAENRFEIGAGYEYWHNKFGNNHATVPGSSSHTPMLIMKAHL